MKYRSDFVTNSSSSSFLIAFHSKEEGLSEITKLISSYGPSYIGHILRDFDAAEPISIDQIVEHWEIDLENDASHLIDYDHRWNDSEFKRSWLASHPDSSSWDYYDSPERKAKIRELVDDEMKKIRSDIGDRSYIVDIGYEDHSEAGSELEHRIMPYLPCTVRRFSRH